jgi:SAM-dependent methyltransferase
MSYKYTSVRACDVCSSHTFEQLTTIRCMRIPDATPPVSICRSCGFVTISPRYSPADYREINARWYPLKFSMHPPEDPSESIKFQKWRVMWDRIGMYYPDGPTSVLDVGAGQGWAIEFLLSKFSDLEAVAIEQWKPCQEYIRNSLGAQIVDVSITDDWPSDLHGRFDLVILRHTLEHLEEPLKTLQQIGKCLSPEGHLYLVVPDAMSIKAGTPMRTYAFRPLHLHYFNRYTLGRMARLGGLYPLTMDDSVTTGDHGETWGLFGNTDRSLMDEAFYTFNSYATQREYLLERMAMAGKERGRILKSWLRPFVPELVLNMKRRLVTGRGK